MHNMQLVFVNSQSGFAEVSCMLSWEGGVCILSLVGFRFQTVFLCPREGTFLAMMSYMTENQFVFPICQLPPFFLRKLHYYPTTTSDSQRRQQSGTANFKMGIFFNLNIQLRGEISCFLHNTVDRC